MTAGMVSHARSMSDAVVKRPTEKRRLARARSFERPMALSTCEGFTDPLVQAEPAEQQIPFSSRRINAPSLSMPSKEIFVVFGRRFTRSPLMEAPEIDASRLDSKRSRSVESTPSARCDAASSADFQKATIEATF